MLLGAEGFCLLNATEGTQLHRCVPCLQGVFSLCLEQPPLDCWPWWRAGEAPFGSFWFEMGFCPQTANPPSHCLLSWLFFWKQGKLPGKGIHHRVWPRALHLTLVPKWKNVHGMTRALWCRDHLFPFVIHWQTRCDQPTLSFWLSITPELVEKSFTVHGGDWWLKSEPASVHHYRHNTFPQRTKVRTNVLPTQPRIVSRNVTLKVQKRPEGAAGRNHHTSQ